VGEGERGREREREREGEGGSKGEREREKIRQQFLHACKAGGNVSCAVMHQNIAKHISYLLKHGRHPGFSH